MSHRETKSHNNNKLTISTIVKHLFPLVITILVYISSKSLLLLFIGLIELSVIFFLTNAILSSKRNIIGYSLNSILLLIFNIQFFVKYFSGTFVNLIMLTNFESLDGLSGKFPIYIGGTILVLLFSFLPVGYVKFFKNNTAFLSAFLAFELLITMLYGNSYSQAFGVYNIALQYKNNMELRAAIKAQGNVTKEFYKDKISSARDTDKKLPKNPNVVVIFTEGLSQHVIDDERNIMPNVKDLQNKSITFNNYYNHTFATYRGLIGQLYSGYQLENYDKNNLVSIQSILKNNGYSTTFINAEPKNTQFTSYLESFGFDKVISDYKNTKGNANSLSDEQSYNKLFETMQKENENGKPFFTSIYTYGTHQTFDSSDKKFKDGKDKVLNRFYNADYYFGKFMKKFNKSKLSKNTVLVFTTDHSTFADAEYKSAFPKENRANPDLGTMPLSIYFKGISPERLDVQGRNSLSLAPTVLDYIGVSEENYFLGVSLFFGKDNNNSYDTIFHDNSYTLSSDKASIQAPTATQQEIIDNQLQKYFAAKQQIVEK